MAKNNSTQIFKDDVIRFVGGCFQLGIHANVVAPPKTQ